MIKSYKIKKQDIDINLYNLVSYILGIHNENYIISGGFARFVASKVINLKWSENISFADYFLKTKGDVDIFYCDSFTQSKIKSTEAHIIQDKTKDLIYRAMNQKDVSISNHTPRYKSLFCHNISFIINQDNNYAKDFKIQNVYGYKFSNFESFFESFDLNNSKWILSKQDKNIFLIYDEKALIADSDMRVSLSNINAFNPLLARRISKYINSKGMSNGITDDSYSKIYEYITHALSNDWSDKYFPLMSESSDLHREAISKNVINNLYECKAINKAQMALFIGRWSDHIPVKVNDIAGYKWTTFKEVDFASNAINQL